MRERRNQLFNRHRFGSELNSRHIQDKLTEIIREEIKNLTLDWKENISQETDEFLTEEQMFDLENEVIREQEQWMLQEYDRISQEEDEYLAILADNESNDVTCPTCQKAMLAEESNCLTCAACGLMLAGRTMQEAKRLIDKCVYEHATNCIKTPTFTVISESGNINLYMVCYDCSTLALIC
ncbi:PREDICTED: RPA-interacting protein-like isoform X2 [Dinoponera quadriceps]|nr:PREDICTED: RPA-interacting protein-like isoform X2 [Dinoponera quadriceps]